MPLASHPFAVQAQLSRTTVLTYAVPVAELQRLLPPCLTPDTLDGTWGFVAVALVQTRQLRPQGLPAWLGTDFFLIGYRVFVRYTTTSGKKLRGLYILGSATDKRRMQWLGNLFTHYRYRTIDIEHTANPAGLTYYSRQAGLTIAVAYGMADETTLPSGSPFSSWAVARRFAGPLPFTFSYNPHNRKVTIVQGEREAWHPQPVQVHTAQVAFVEALGLRDVRLASAFTMTDIPYCWQKGHTEQWQG